MYFDSLVHDPATLGFLTDLVGAERVALGTDYPFPLGELEPGKLIDSMPYDDAAKAMLLSGAALKWLGLDGRKFL
jgi:aminocarboxymuconate-semialdehyde decarboxylase